MIAAVTVSQRDFYLEFLMARNQFNPREFGVNMDKDEFIDLMVDEFNSTYRGGWSFDEFLLHPREASQFCDGVRRKHSFFDVPDDILLRAVMMRRKNPSG